MLIRYLRRCSWEPRSAPSPPWQHRPLTSVADFKRVLKKANVSYIHALQDFDKVIVHSDDGLEAYSLDLMARVCLGTGRPQDLDASRERVSEANAAVVLARVVKVGGRTIGACSLPGRAAQINYVVVQCCMRRRALCK